MDENGPKHYVGHIFRSGWTIGVNISLFGKKADILWIEKEKIVLKVEPVKLSTTCRQNRKLSFNINLAVTNFY